MAEPTHAALAGQSVQTAANIKACRCELLDLEKTNKKTSP